MRGGQDSSTALAMSAKTDIITTIASNRLLLLLVKLAKQWADFAKMLTSSSCSMFDDVSLSVRGRIADVTARHALKLVPREYFDTTADAWQKNGIDMTDTYADT